MSKQLPNCLQISDTSVSSNCFIDAICDVSAYYFTVSFCHWMNQVPHKFYNVHY